MHGASKKFANGELYAHLISHELSCQSGPFICKKLEWFLPASEGATPPDYRVQSRVAGLFERKDLYELLAVLPLLVPEFASQKPLTYTTSYCYLYFWCGCLLLSLFIHWQWPKVTSNSHAPLAPINTFHRSVFRSQPPCSGAAMSSRSASDGGDVSDEVRSNQIHLSAPPSKQLFCDCNTYSGVWEPFFTAWPPCVLPPCMHVLGIFLWTCFYGLSIIAG